jgi:hypothetical protein
MGQLSKGSAEFPVALGWEAVVSQSMLTLFGSVPDLPGGRWKFAVP